MKIRLEQLNEVETRQVAKDHAEAAWREHPLVDVSVGTIFKRVVERRLRLVEAVHRHQRLPRACVPGDGVGALGRVSILVEGSPIVRFLT